MAGFTRLGGTGKVGMFAQELTTALKHQARQLGFQLAGACPAVGPEGIHRLFEWLDAGYAGQMHYLPGRADAYRHPESVLPGVRSLLMLGMNYRTCPPATAAAGQGRVSRYAWGVDYHELIRERLDLLAQFLRQLSPDAKTRRVVDTAPLLEREFAQLAGLGWIGKNTLLLNKRQGSWFFLAALLTDLTLEYDDPHAANHCGTCRACLDACPTEAFVEPYVLDSRRCISYLTIELREPVPNTLRGGLGDWLFGCDVCQEVCPWNHRAPESDEPDFEPGQAMNPIDLAPLFWLSDEQFHQRFRHTPLWRPKRRGLLRNAALLLGNHPNKDALPALCHGLNDSEALVRGACAWALGEFRAGAATSSDTLFRWGEAALPAQQALQNRAAKETDPQVQQEICQALTTRH